MSPSRTEDGNLPDPAGTVTGLLDRVKPLSLTIYTTAFEDTPPAPVTELKAERFHDTKIPGGWRASASNDVVYYRVFYGDERAGSTDGIRRMQSVSPLKKNIFAMQSTV